MPPEKPIQVDYIVVGLGIAGIAITEVLLQQGKKVLVFSNPELPQATRVSGGIINPLVLKHLRPVWQVETLLPKAINFYKALLEKLKIAEGLDVPIYRIFSSVEDQNNWVVSSDKPNTQAYLGAIHQDDLTKSIHTPFCVGEVQQAIRVPAQKIVTQYANTLLEKGCLIQETFNWECLKKEKTNTTTLQYKQFKARYIVSCEGPGILQNPFYKAEWILPKKGEYLIIHAPQLQTKAIWKGTYFILPQEAGYYKIGATFIHNDLSTAASNTGKQALLDFCERVLQVPFKVVHYQVGFRPTTKDRRPLLGWLSAQWHIAMFNGLGARGWLAAPTMAEALVAFIESGRALPPEVVNTRF